MSLKLSRFAVLAALAIPCAALAAEIKPHFSVDPASASIDGDITPDDVLVTGPTVYTHGTDLGLYDDFFVGEFDVLNALSYGRDPIIWPLYFSVDRVAVGLPGTAVFEEALPGNEEASGDVFYSRGSPAEMQNYQFIDEEQLGLVPGFFGDDLDAVDLDQEPSPWYYFSIDQLSRTNGYGTGCVTSDILASIGGGGWGTYFPLEALGFDCIDDLDALVLWDEQNNGVVDVGEDFALFSISTFSPSTFTSTGLSYIPGQFGHMSPADVMWTDFTQFRVLATAADLGLRDDDELNALDTVPEPLTGALLCTGLLVMWRVRRWVSSAA
jgi:hypothetical protein